MPSAVAPNPRAASPMVDDYDAAVSDFLRDLPQHGNDKANEVPAPPKDDDDEEEIQIKRQRKPVAKLDENLILSQQGVPKLRKVAKSRLKFKGKGHEFSDIERLLGLYQLWLDDMFPRAKFRDGLTMIERLGHKKRLQVYRRAWIDESKPTTVREDEERLEDMEMSGTLMNESGDGIFGNNGNAIEDERISEAQRETGLEEAPEGDELDALMAEGSQNTSHASPDKRGQSNSNHRMSGQDEPEDDELDALLAENEARTGSQPVEQPRRVKMPFEEDDEDEDELDALLAEHETMRRGDQSSTAAPTNVRQSEPDFGDDEEAMADLGW
ncbi:Swi3-domain-containing protein [Polychaeton citri CBS 116435]|uniref:Chromosome segregation in meiosis protein n=1 Tax=Polychaeton citri CBS 116435 TaxID=1314669 RepID=A0A9P4QGJ9_9PEZI|nr:Swi3-domain-containing protein [Polychaeton citri CBS 116435]